MLLDEVTDFGELSYIGIVTGEDVSKCVENMLLFLASRWNLHLAMFGAEGCSCYRFLGRNCEWQFLVFKSDMSC